MSRTLALCALLVPLSPLGCRSEDDGPQLSIDAPEYLALEGTREFAVVNECDSSPCNRSEVENVESLEVDDAKVAKVERIDATTFRLQGLRAGKTKLHARAMLADGSTLESSRTVNVIPIDEIRVERGECGNPEGADPQLLPYGASAIFKYSCYGQGKRLAGTVENLFEGTAEGFSEGAGVTDFGGGCDFGIGQFRSPDSDAKIPLVSRFDTDMGVEFEIFGPDCITDITIAPLPSSFYDFEWFYVSGYVHVGDRIACGSVNLPITRSLTLEYCVGDTGGARALGEGTCRVVVSPAGSSVEREVEFSIEFSPSDP